MYLASSKLLFSLNSEYCPDNCYGFVKKSIFNLFNNNSDWTFSLRCKINDCHHNQITLFALEGADLALNYSQGALILTCKDNSGEHNEISFSFQINIKNRINELQIFSLSYNVGRNLYSLYCNDELLGESKLSSRKHISSKKIRLCVIGRQFTLPGGPSTAVGIDISEIDIRNIIFAEKILSYSEIKDYFDLGHDSCELDKYGRSVLKEGHKQKIIAYYNFTNNLDGKIWDLTTNNNFFYTSLDQQERVGSSVI